MYKLAKCFVSILFEITQNEFTVKDSFLFVKEVLMQDSNLDMASLDVDSFCINISVDETIDICIEKLFPNLETLVK